MSLLVTSGKDGIDIVCGPTVYEIAWSEVQTNEDKLGVLLRLSEKSWFTRQHLKQLLGVLGVQFR